MSEVEVEAGANVITLDDYGTAIYFVEQGDADVLQEGGEANESVGPGDVFGEIGLLLTGQRTATVVALTPMRLLSLSGSGLRPNPSNACPRSNARSAASASSARADATRRRDSPPSPVAAAKLELG